MLTNLLHGLGALGNGPAIAYLVGGSLIGVFVGVIPGLSGAVILSVVLAFIYHINIDGVLSLFLATQAGSYFSASITSILLNTPAHPEAFAVTFDGFPMAQRGEAGRALGISASSTCIGGFIGCAVLVGFLQIINYLPLLFHPPEYVALVVIAILLIGTLGTDAASKALISGGMGLMLACIGSDPITGVFRFTFGAVGLYSGISLVALFLGLFAIPQMVLVFGTASTVASQDMMGNEVSATKGVTLEKGFGKQVIQGIFDSLHHWVALIRAALIGVVTGVIPGIGGFAANFMSYGIAQQASKTPELFGTGIPEGIIAAEGSSLSKEAGGMVPVLGLGIPGGVGNALFLAALTIKGIRVGYGFTQSYPTLAYETVWVIALGGLVGTVAGVLAAAQLAKVTRVPGPALVPFIMAISIIGTFVADISFFSVMEMMVFAFVGFVLRRLRYSLAAFGIGLILGPTLEQNIYLTHTVFPGFTFLRRPLADVLFVLAFVVLGLKTVQLRREAKRQDKAFEEEDALSQEAGGGRVHHRLHPYPLLSVLVIFGILGITVPFMVYAVTKYNFLNFLLPVLSAGAAAAAAAWRMPFELRNYALYRQNKREAPNLAAIAAQVAQAEEPELAASVGGDMIEAFGRPPNLSAKESRTVHMNAWGSHGQYTREVIAFLWFGALVLLSYIFGFTIGGALFCIVYGLSATGSFLKTWPKRAVFAILSAAVVWGTSYEMFSILHLSFSPLINF